MKSMTKICPRCGFKNVFELKDGQADIIDIDTHWLKCSFCDERPSKFEWIAKNKDSCVSPNMTDEQELQTLRYNVAKLRQRQHPSHRVKVIALLEDEINNRIGLGNAIDECREQLHCAVTTLGNISSIEYLVKGQLYDAGISLEIIDSIAWFGDLKRMINDLDGYIRKAQDDINAVLLLLDPQNNKNDRI